LSEKRFPNGMTCSFCKDFKLSMSWVSKLDYV